MMNVSQEQLHKAIMAYAEEEIAMKATGLAKFGSYFLISSLYNRPDKTVGALLNHPFIQMTDIVNTDGTIKADELYSAARSAMEKAHSIMISGITFGITDIDKLYSILQRG
jgi:hypothetical protein